MAKLSYSLTEAAEATGLSRSHFDEAIRSGKLIAKTTTAKADTKSRGGKRVILARDLEAYVESLPGAES